MKKIIYLLILCSAISAQSLDLREQKLTPKKGVMPKKQGLVSDDIPATIILDRKDSILKWKGGLKFSVSNHSGTLKIKQGRILLMKDKNFTGGRIEINMATMTNTDLSDPGKKERLIGHLRSKDFFDIEHFPTASLSIKSSKLIGKTNDGLYNVQITGDLTIKSTTKPITFNAIIDLDSKVKKATGTLTFNRTDFGVQYRAEMHLDNPDSFWNQLRSARDTTKDRVIRDEIEIEFEMNSLPGMLRK